MAIFTELFIYLQMRKDTVEKNPSNCSKEKSYNYKKNIQSHEQKLL